MAIYSLRENCWKVKPNWVNELERSLAFKKNYDSGVYTHDNVVYSQGVIYWKPTLLFSSKNLIYFDIEDETFGINELHVVLNDDYLKIVFVLSGSLAVLGISYSEICIWVMDKQEWCQYVVRDSNVKPHEGAYAEACAIFTVFDKYHNIVYDERNHTFLACCYDELKSYNIITNKVQHLTNSHWISYFGIYVESLVLLNQAKLKR
jgi:F-box associated protein